MSWTNPRIEARFMGLPVQWQEPITAPEIKRGKMKKQKCPKCGFETCVVAYHKGFGACSFLDNTSCSIEHLHVTCKRCDYDWVIGTDNEKPSEKDAGKKE